MSHAKNTKNVTVEPALFESYMAFIKGSVDSNMFRKFYANVITNENPAPGAGGAREVLDDGRLSCAVYASSILKLFNLCSDIQLTVHRLLDDMEQNGWYEIEDLKEGAIVLWGENDEQTKEDQGSKVQVARNKHLGFYLNNEEAISHRKDVKSPIIHPLHYREVKAYFWHDKLEK